MINSKKAFQLSVNFIVVLIMAIAVFSTGMYLAYRTFGIFEEKRAQLDAQTESHIESMLAGGEKVAIPIQKKMIDKGSAVFGLGVLNVDKDPHTFDINVEKGPYYDIKSVPGVFNADVITTLDGWTLVGTKWTGSIFLQPNEDKKIAILTTIEDPTTGLYSFIVRVNDESGEYGSPQVIYVEVP